MMKTELLQHADKGYYQAKSDKAATLAVRRCLLTIGDCLDLAISK